MCILASTSQNYTFHRKNLKCQNGQISRKQVFFTKQKHCLTQIFVRNHYSEAEIRDFLEIVCILASTSQNDTFHRKNLSMQKWSY